LASRTAPIKATTLMTVPITPVVTLPLSRHITLSARSTARTETDDHQVAVPIRPDRKLEPPMSTPVTARTQKIASTDFRPSVVQ
jgi:hypothetical protein